MGGWGKQNLNITPSGKVLPCHAAETIETLTFDNVQDRPLEQIWREGAAFQAFRGTDWMEEPCKNCDRRFTDFDGCRCQAFAGRATATDPACSFSPSTTNSSQSPQKKPASPTPPSPTAPPKMPLPGAGLTCLSLGQTSASRR